MSAGVDRGTLSAEIMVRGRRALVVGGTDECMAKVARLLLAGANVLVVAEDPIDPSISALAERGEIALERRGYREGDEMGAVVTFVSRDLIDIGTQLARAAERTGALVSTLDRPEASTFVNPAVAERHGLKIALSSGGRSPGLLRKLREGLEKALDDERLGVMLAEIHRVRSALPREQRKTEVDKLLRDFRVEVSFAFPAWVRTGAGESPK